MKENNIRSRERRAFDFGLFIRFNRFIKKLLAAPRGAEDAPIVGGASPNFIFLRKSLLVSPY